MFSCMRNLHTKQDVKSYIYCFYFLLTTDLISFGQKQASLHFVPQMYKRAAHPPLMYLHNGLLIKICCLFGICKLFFIYYDKLQQVLMSSFLNEAKSDAKKTASCFMSEYRFRFILMQVLLTTLLSH